MTVLHRQGFESVEEVEHCILEPGGTFDVKGIDPPRRRSAPRRSHARPEGSHRQDRRPGAGARPGLTFYNKDAGGMGEWLIPAVLKTVNGETRSGVRIPLPPPLPSCPNSLFWPEFGSPSALISNHEDELAVPPASLLPAFTAQAADVCNPADLVGPYAFQLTGLTNISGTPKPTVSLGRLTFDGRGNLSGTASATFTGLLLGNPVTGSYEAKSDCSITWKLQDTSGGLPEFQRNPLGRCGQRPIQTDRPGRCSARHHERRHPMRARRQIY